MPAADAMMTTENEDSFETNNQVGLLTTDAYFLRYLVQLTMFFLRRSKAWMRQTLLSQMVVSPDLSAMHKKQHAINLTQFFHVHFTRRLCVRSVWRFAVRLERNRWNQGRIYYGHAI
jgi:hypothetical protein